MTQMSGEQLKLLLHGLDTVQCAYYLTPPTSKHLSFAKLAAAKEQLRMDKSREPRAVSLGGTEFFIHPYGSTSGYPFLLSNEDFKIECGEFQQPVIFRDISKSSPVATLGQGPP